MADKSDELRHRVAELEAELDGLRGRIAARKPLALLRDFKGNVNISKLKDAEPPDGYAFLNSNKLQSVFWDYKDIAHAPLVRYSTPNGRDFYTADLGWVVEEEKANGLAAYCQELEAGRESGNPWDKDKLRAKYGF